MICRKVVGEWPERFDAGRRELWRDVRQVVERVEGCFGRILHVEAVELHLAGVGRIPVPHPRDQRQHLLGVPGPEARASQCVGRIADAVQDVIVDAPALRVARLDAEYREAELGDAELEQAVLQLEKLARAMRRLAERNDAGIADDPAQRFEVGKSVAGLDGRERDGAGAYPVDGFEHKHSLLALSAIA
jgi:hypothetical protein